mmetsp:Transcript_4637/g.17475  ORF Transcript_4637/g.17475 Transcript_4637/m.17475 type:complete len:461 (+) Transcript_4637:3-1385(+)
MTSPLHVLLAFDSFKNSLSAEKIHDALSKTISQLYPSSQIDSITLSDGGEGFLSSLSEGQLLYLSDSVILGPDGIPLSKPVPFRKCERVIYVEMACSSGIELVQEPNCMICSSFGTGQVIREILLRHLDVDRIVMGVGGTATSEAGVGALLALGKGVVVDEIELTQENDLFYQGLDKITWMQEQSHDDDRTFRVEPLQNAVKDTLARDSWRFFTGQDLAMLKDIKFSKWAQNRMQQEEVPRDEERYQHLKNQFLERRTLAEQDMIEFMQMRLDRVHIDIASDVKTAFCGTNGAVSVYSEQKGASSVHLRKSLERGMLVLREKLLKLTGRDICQVEGSGAAGGISGMFHNTLNASIESGIELMAQQRNLESFVEKADLVLTGEGRFDSQTAEGKTVSHVCKMARKHGKCVVIICGQNLVQQTNLPVYALVDRFEVSQCMKNTAHCLQELLTENWKKIMQND